MFSNYMPDADNNPKIVDSLRLIPASDFSR